MYIPEKLKMGSLEQMQQFIQEFSFGIMVSDPLQATHIPFLLEKGEGKFGTLYTHFAKANNHGKDLLQASSHAANQVMLIFSGPHAYISPSWYASKPAVPTWNYAAVHVYGEVELLDGAETLALIYNTVNHYEPTLKDTDIITDEYRDRLIKAISAVRIKITKIEGKLKLGQHRSIADQKGVAKGLETSNDLGSKALLGYMDKLGLGFQG